MDNFEEVIWAQLGNGEQFYFYHGEKANQKMTGPYIVKDKANGHYTKEGLKTYYLFYGGTTLVRWTGEGPGPVFFKEPKRTVYGGTNDLR